MDSPEGEPEAPARSEPDPSSARTHVEPPHRWESSVAASVADPAAPPEGAVNPASDTVLDPKHARPAAPAGGLVHKSAGTPTPGPTKRATSSDQTLVEPRAAPLVKDGPAKDSDRTLTEGRDASSGMGYLPGSYVGPYEVVKFLGQGSMGTVLHARHRELKREVALKVLSLAASNDPDSVERFRRESEAVARLDHPNIVRLYERGRADGIHYFAMELVKGIPLDAVIRRERMPYAEAARLISQCAHAIDYAHGIGILHRDLKPANILLEDSGRARVTDFGLAHIDQKATLTSAGTVVGTPLYLAPEVARGERGSRRSDIYSLGATLYELATGRPPYEGRDARTVMQRVLNEAPIPPEDADPRVPRDLVRIIAKAMARDPEDRYAHARSLANDLDQFAQGRSVALKGGGAAFRETAASRYWKRAVATVTIMGSIGALAVFVIWLDRAKNTAEREKQKAERELRRLREDHTTAPAVPRGVDEEGARASQDRDIRARIGLKQLGEDATDAGAKKHFDELVARARESEKDSPGTAATILREALVLFPHEWETRIELARTLTAVDGDDAENELSMIALAPDSPKAAQLRARLERARIERFRAVAAKDANQALVPMWLASSDLRLVSAARFGATDSERAGVSADLAFTLAYLGDVKVATAILDGLPDVSGDEVARVALARLAIARAVNDGSRADAELARARDAAQSDEQRKLVEMLTR
jgi:thioredoxin-like negative regulator of GroEL